MAVLHILGVILKILGIAVLSVIGLVILLILLVSLVRVGIDAEYIGGKPQGVGKGLRQAYRGLSEQSAV